MKELEHNAKSSDALRYTPSNGKGSAPRNNQSEKYRQNYDDIFRKVGKRKIHATIRK